MVSMDAFASAFGFDSKSDDVWTTLGKVTAVGSGTLSVLLGGSATPTECEAYCVAGVGDIVFVAITKGRARAIAKRGNILSIPDSAVTDASQTPSANQYGSALHVTDQQGEQVGYLGLIHETDDDLWTQLGVTRDVNGSPAYNSLWLGLEDDGTPIVSFGGVDQQQAWHDALSLDAYLKRKPTDLPQDTTPNSGFPLVLSDTFANDGEISYMSAANFRTLIDIGAWGQMYDTTGQITLSNSWQKIPMTNFEGVGTSASSNGIKVTSAGIYVISGQFRVSNGFNNNDLIHVGLFVNENVKAEGCRRMITTGDWGTVETAPRILQLAANDVVSIRAKNEGGARGYVPKGYPELTYLSVKQIA